MLLAFLVIKTAI